MPNKSYNLMALRGMDVDDKEVQDTMRKAGIVVPDSMLYTPELPRYIIDAAYNKNLEALPKETNESTGLPYTTEEATAEAETNRMRANMNLEDLLKNQ